MLFVGKTEEGSVPAAGHHFLSCHIQVLKQETLLYTKNQQVAAG